MFRFKRFMISLVITIAFVLYYIVIDPNTAVLKDIPGGVLLVLTLQIVVVSALGIWLVEVVPDFFLDYIYGKERDIANKAKESHVGAGYALIAKSLRILGYCTIVAAAIVTLNN